MLIITPCSVVYIDMLLHNDCHLLSGSIITLYSTLPQECPTVQAGQSSPNCPFSLRKWQTETSAVCLTYSQLHVFQTKSHLNTTRITLFSTHTQTHSSVVLADMLSQQVLAVLLCNVPTWPSMALCLSRRCVTWQNAVPTGRRWRANWGWCWACRTSCRSKSFPSDCHKTWREASIASSCSFGLGKCVLWADF